MDISCDYKELFRIFNKYKVKYLVVGAYAVIFYTEPRYTKDIDIWINPEIENARRVYAALKEFGAPLKGISEEDFINKRLFYQIGVAPIRVDIVMGLKGLDFNSAWQRRKKASYGGTMINIISLSDLRKSKSAVNRPQDLLDIEKIDKLIKGR